MSGIRSRGTSPVHRRNPGTGRVQPLIHYPGVCGGDSCRACAIEQEIAERNEQ